MQVIACLVMLAATVKMKHLSKKNGFERRRFSDIELNLTVSVLIAVGYTVDYVTEVTCTILVLREYITLDQQQTYIVIGQLCLMLCIFSAYIILMRVFFTYQSQVNEAAARIEAAKEKARIKAERKA